MFLIVLPNGNNHGSDSDSETLSAQDQDAEKTVRTKQLYPDQMPSAAFQAHKIRIKRNLK